MAREKDSGWRKKRPLRVFVRVLRVGHLGRITTRATDPLATSKKFAHPAHAVARKPPAMARRPFLVPPLRNPTGITRMETLDIVP